MKTFVTSHCVTPVTRDCASQMLISAFLFRRVALNSTLMVGLKVLLGSLLRINFLCYFLENGLIRKKIVDLPNFWQISCTRRSRIWELLETSLTNPKTFWGKKLHIKKNILGSKMSLWNSKKKKALKKNESRVRTQIVFCFGVKLVYFLLKGI